jgi:aryl-alcohol dehydrogenase-like predicted oxidoreductase
MDGTRWSQRPRSGESRRQGDPLSRRGFMAGVSVPLGALALWQGGKLASAEDAAQAGEGLIHRTLGRTGIRIPIVSMGVMNASAPAIVEQSYRKGIRLFDTAWFYQRGMNESMVGDTIQRLGCRDQVVIATKVFLKETERDLYAPGIKQLFLDRFAQSLKRLKTDHVDILYYHAAGDVREMNNPPILEAFAELKQAGKIRWCGVSFHGDQAAQLADMTRSGFYDVALVLFNAAMGDAVAGGDAARLVHALQAAADSGIGLVAMKTQCGGGGSWAARSGGQGELDQLNHTALLKWVLRHPFITTAIPGHTTFEQMEQNVSVARSLDLTDEERSFLEGAKVDLVEGFCALCDTCRGQCARGVDIPTLMRAHMYAYGYGNLELALATCDTVPRQAGLTACDECPVCTVRCPRRVDVRGRLAGLQAITSAYA